MIVFIDDIKSNKWLAYFLLVISIYILNLLPVNHLYDLDGMYAYINPDFSYINRFAYEFMRLALPFLTIIGVYRLVCFEKFTFKALFASKKGVFVLVLVILIFHSLEEMLIGVVTIS